MNRAGSLARALAFWRHAEGGYTGAAGLAGDPGGATNWGIAAAFHPGVNVATLTWTQAAEILVVRYWKRHHVDQVASVAPLAAWALFDFVANANAHAAKRHFQREIGTPDDGDIGRKTIAAARRYVARRGDVNLATRLILRRTRRQMRRIRSGASSINFAEGWSVRFVELAAAINREGNQ